MVRGGADSALPEHCKSVVKLPRFESLTRHYLHRRSLPGRRKTRSSLKSRGRSSPEAEGCERFPHLSRYGCGQTPSRVGSRLDHIGQRHARVPGHPVRHAMSKIVKGPVRAQGGVGAAKHHPSRVEGQSPQRATRRPPQRLVPTGRDQTVHPRLIQPEPHERVRRRGQLLKHAGSLSHHRDQLLAPDRRQRP